MNKQELKLKNKLDLIIKTAYKDHPRLKQMLFYRLEILPKTTRTSLGLYRFLERKIEVNLGNTPDNANILMTLIHELSHHIEYILTGQSGHKKSFYDIHRALLYTALDLKLLSLNECLRMDRASRNYNKIIKILYEYKPHNQAAPELPDEIELSVYESFLFKDILKNKNYIWDSIARRWYKVLAPELVRREKDELLSLNIPEGNIEERKASKLQVISDKHISYYGYVGVFFLSKRNTVLTKKIYTQYPELQAQVSKNHRNYYKKFFSLEEAKAWVNDTYRDLYDKYKT